MLQREAGASEWKLSMGRLANVFGYGAEISRICIVKLIQMNQKSGVVESSMVEVTQNLVIVPPPAQTKTAHNHLEQNMVGKKLLPHLDPFDWPDATQSFQDQSKFFTRN